MTSEHDERPEFDREKISHVTDPVEGFALANGCQGIFIGWTFSHYEEALAKWVENGGFDNGADEQIVRISISIIHDHGRPEEVEPRDFVELGCDPHFTTERFTRPCGCRTASCLCHIGAEQKAADAMIDAFAQKLKAKFKKAKTFKGRTGWDEENWSWSCWKQMRVHCAKGDPVDVGLFAAFAWNMSDDAERSAELACEADQFREGET